MCVCVCIYIYTNTHTLYIEIPVYMFGKKKVLNKKRQSNNVVCSYLFVFC